MNKNLEHYVWKQIKSFGLQKNKFLVALSGGADSIALLHLLNEVLPQGQLFAAYIHHGDSSLDPRILKYRNQALKFCRKSCKNLSIPFFSLKIKPGHKSGEAELREQRYAALALIMKKKNIEILSLGHHLDDLLETRLIRLIRGVSEEGLVSMKSYAHPLFRPLLGVEKKEIVLYLRDLGQDFVEDPSNQEVEYLRNWIRMIWLPELEKKRKGSIKTLARSLEQISQKTSRREPSLSLYEKSQKILANEGVLSRVFYLTLSSEEKTQILAQYLISQNKYQFSLAQLEEIKKNLDKSKKEHTFRVVACQWICDAERILIAR